MEATAIIDDAGVLATSGTTDPVPWWSFTKLVLAAASLRLVEQNLLRLDDIVDARGFSLRQLLRHGSGLPDYGSLPGYHAAVAAGGTPWPVARLLRAVDAGRLRYRPGENWAYSNIGYLEVARLIERGSGKSLREALHALVLEPAGSTSARLASTPADLACVEMGHVQGYHPGWVFHGLLTGTVADAARLLRALMAGSILRPDTLTDMFRGRALPQFRDIHPDPAYGLGVMLRATSPLDHPLGHGGEGPGSSISVFAEGRRAAATWVALPSTVEADARTLALLSEAKGGDTAGPARRRR